MASELMNGDRMTAAALHGNKTEKFHAFNEMVRTLNALQANFQTLLPFGPRGGAFGYGSDLFDRRRNIGVECGWPDPSCYSVADYGRLYDDYGLARRVVNVYPHEAWNVFPEVYETEDESATTEFEQAWLDLDERVNALFYLRKLTVDQGVGRFGALFMGFDDGGGFEEPLPGYNKDGTPRANRKALNLVYLRSFEERCVRVREYETDRNSARYGMPLLYDLLFSSPALAGAADSAPQAVMPGEWIVVHWTRVFHGTDSGETFSLPRLRPVLTHLADLRKTFGGSAEMYWQNAIPLLSIEQLPEVVDDSDIDLDSVRKQMQALGNHLQRWISLQGMTAKSLAPGVSSPKDAIDVQFMGLCAVIEVPVRVFTGSEAAHLASTQDIGTWRQRLTGYQNNTLTPRTVRPFVRRLQDAGALPPAKKVKTAWRDLNATTDAEKAGISMKLSQALAQYASSGSETVVPLREFLTVFMGLTGVQADMILVAKKTDMTKEVWAAPATAAAPTAAKNGQGGRTSRRAKR